jgi:hypothetical protein
MSGVLDGRSQKMILAPFAYSCLGITVCQLHMTASPMHAKLAWFHPSAAFWQRTSCFWIIVGIVQFLFLGHWRKILHDDEMEVNQNFDVFILNVECDF